MHACEDLALFRTASSSVALGARALHDYEVGLNFKKIDHFQEGNG